MQAGLTSHLRHATMSKKREEDEERQHGGGGGRERGERAAESGRTEWVAVALGALFAREEEGRVVSLAPLQNFRRSCWGQAQTRARRVAQVNRLGLKSHAISIPGARMCCGERMRRFSTNLLLLQSARSSRNWVGGREGEWVDCCVTSLFWPTCDTLLLISKHLG